MKIDFPSKTIALSAHEFAEFSWAPRFGQPAMRGETGRWRAELGQHWHRELQAHCRAEHPSAEVSFERPIEGRLSAEGWHLLIGGRVDQWIQYPDHALLREVKSVDRPLPTAESELLASYPAYELQTLLYAGLAREAGWAQTTALRAELVFVAISSGTLQVVELPLSGDKRLQVQACRIAEFARQRSESLQALRTRPIPSPFRSFRAGQEGTQLQIRKAIEQEKLILLEAPTGFGKTGLALDAAFYAMQRGQAARIIYATGQTTGQNAPLIQLERLLEQGLSARYFLMRSRSDQEAVYAPPEKLDAVESAQRWEASGIQPPALFDPSLGTVPFDTIIELSRQWGLSPFDISKAVLPFAEVWLGDLNYVFNPHNSSVYFERAGFDARHTILICDEAHHLASRVAGNFSHQFTATAIRDLVFALQWTGLARELTHCLEELARFLTRIKPTERLAGTEHFEWLSLLTAYRDRLLKTFVDPDEVDDAVLQQLWQPVEALENLENGQLQMLEWSGREQHLQVQCLDASPLIRETLSMFGSALLMSATLSPIDRLRAELGQPDPPGTWIAATAAWRSQAYDVAIDTRVDTRYRTRDRYHQVTAWTLIQWRRHSSTPVAAYFPSFAYAETVAEICQQLDPITRICLQPRQLERSDLGSFIDEAVLYSDLILLVLGSRFSEGVDDLGGRVESVMIVSPALPEVNAAQKARLEFYTGQSRDTGFRDVYVIPGLRKVNQALGRLVRQPGQQARVLLHCSRFADELYHALLAPEYSDFCLLPDDDAVLQWMQAGTSTRS